MSEIRYSYSIRVENEHDHYYFWDAACYSKARFKKTVEEAYRHTVLYPFTSANYFMKIADLAIEAVLKGQTDKRYWLTISTHWVTVFAEQCYWFTDISTKL